MKLKKHTDFSKYSDKTNWETLDKATRAAKCNYFTDKWSKITAFIVYWAVIALGGLLFHTVMDEKLFIDWFQWLPFLGWLRELNGFLCFLISASAVLAAAFVVSFLFYLVARGITTLLSRLVCKVQKKPMPQDELEKVRAFIQRIDRIGGKYYWFDSHITVCLVFSVICAVAFGAIPVVNECIKENWFFSSDTWYTNALLGLFYLVKLAIWGGIFWVATACVMFGLESILENLEPWSGISLSTQREYYYKRLLELDPEENKRYLKQQAEEKKQAKAKADKENEYIKSMAKLYNEEQKETEEYLKRLHEWATGDDDPKNWRGMGDGM